MEIAIVLFVIAVIFITRAGFRSRFIVLVILITAPGFWLVVVILNKIKIRL